MFVCRSGNILSWTLWAYFTRGVGIWLLCQPFCTRDVVVFSKEYSRSWMEHEQGVLLIFLSLRWTFTKFASMLQIVSALMGNRQYADKMLIYAENHNQVIIPSINLCSSSNVCMGLYRMHVWILFTSFYNVLHVSVSLEGSHLLRYCLVKSASTLLARQNLCLEDVHYTK